METPEAKAEREKLEKEALEKKVKEAKEKRKNTREIIITVPVAVYLLLVTVFTTLWIFTNCFQCWKIKLGMISTFNVNEHVTLGLFFAGMLGGAFYCLRSLYGRLADAYAPSDPKKELVPLRMTVWFFWYLYRPLQGGVLALILLVLTKSSLLKLQDVGDADISSYYTLIGIGFLAGFGAHEVIEKIQDIIKVIFASSNGGDGQPGGGNKETKPANSSEGQGADAETDQGAGKVKTEPAKEPQAQDKRSTEDNNTKEEPEGNATEKDSSTENNSPTDLPKDK